MYLLSYFCCTRTRLNSATLPYNFYCNEEIKVGEAALQNTQHCYSCYILQLKKFVLCHFNEFYTRGYLCAQIYAKQKGFLKPCVNQTGGPIISLSDNLGLHHRICALFKQNCQKRTVLKHKLCVLPQTA